MADIPLPLQAILSGYVDHIKGRPRYYKGYKWCTKCGKAYQTDSRFCPVCGAMLRSKPRTRRFRDRYINNRIG